MRRCLIVANQTLPTETLDRAVRERMAADARPTTRSPTGGHR